MNRETIIQMAREAGFRSGNITLSNGEHVPFVGPVSATDCIHELERFYALAVAKEREECAKVCESRYMGDNNREDMEAQRCAYAIRARGEAV